MSKGFERGRLELLSFAVWDVEFDERVPWEGYVDGNYIVGEKIVKYDEPRVRIDIRFKLLDTLEDYWVEGDIVECDNGGRFILNGDGVFESLGWFSVGYELGFMFYQRGQTFKEV